MLLVLLLLLSFQTTATLSTVITWHGLQYRYVSDLLRWEDANEKCSEIGGLLVTIHSEAENLVVRSLIPDGATAHIGISRGR